MAKIIKKLIKYNFSTGNKPEYLVIHDTGNRRKGANALAHFNYFNGGNRGASAHYFVDDKEIIQVVEDCNAAWHCGDGKGKYGITNYNSLGIEICLNSDGDYEQTLKNALVLINSLQDKHGISNEKVVRHFDASRKICPGSMSTENWRKWHEFKKDLAQLNKQINQRNKEKYEDTDLLDPHYFEVCSAITKLHQQGIINSPEYWHKNLGLGGMVKGEYVATLLKRVALKL
ncbi:N-acetylmuramoyl-L-alanine amidase [Desulfonispora thiosulfatigenes DSM 11270]|uniref:N-acetylmuramoyl-L-alanine amidase n=1 Tax=Desulfonispora thiosulfatigenes DSM 11270 TaxID=656914 RepID=A0A1W1V7Z8_DESTI|nr:N-acetylmuramoyl-L-alanine amidase [Desulfonispora thiosulfatigenes]SMB89114.1 N-acetylmuramoyl-L-alanine amidase [Desulfonispora thiosulfatigenes DSM 11270]